MSISSSIKRVSQVWLKKKFKDSFVLNIFLQYYLKLTDGRPMLSPPSPPCCILPPFFGILNPPL